MYPLFLTCVIVGLTPTVLYLNSICILCEPQYSCSVRRVLVGLVVENVEYATTYYGCFWITLVLFILRAVVVIGVHPNLNYACSSLPRWLHCCYDNLNSDGAILLHSVYCFCLYWTEFSFDCWLWNLLVWLGEYCMSCAQNFISWIVKNVWKAILSSQREKKQ